MTRPPPTSTSTSESRKVLTKRSRLEKDTASTSILDATFAPRTQTLHRMVSEADLRKLEENRELERLSLDLRYVHPDDSSVLAPPFIPPAHHPRTPPGGTANHITRAVTCTVRLRDIILVPTTACTNARGRQYLTTLSWGR